jgi:hypothetical protein
LAEVGVGGGGDDFKQEAELEFLDQASLATLFNMFVLYINLAGAELTFTGPCPHLRLRLICPICFRRF